MKAIVLTCDKYIKFAEHMIYTYQKFWPSHPFTFRVPYGEYPSNLEKFGDRVERIQMDAARVNHPVEVNGVTKQVSLIRDTVLNLLEDLPDEEWIYWCMDDKYLIKIQEEKVNDIYNFIQNTPEEKISIIQFIRNRKGGYFKSDKHINKEVQVLTPGGQVLQETVYSQGEFFPDPWPHQFMKVKILRNLFKDFPDRPFVGKEMDSFTFAKGSEDRQLIVAHNLAIIGESTSRGEITENCAASFKRWNMELPDHMKISKTYITVGELPLRWLGFEFNPPPKIQRYVTEMNRWYWRNR